jgi:hypothetical protein
MPMIVVSAETEIHSVREADPNDPWDSGDTSGSVTNVIAFIDPHDGHHYGSSKAKPMAVPFGATVYAVVADYSTGDTFGTSGGHAQVLDFFITVEEAEGLLEAAKAGGDYGFTCNGVTYSRSWVGYFENLNSLDIWEVQVRQNPADPFRPKGTGRYSRKRGH